MKEIFSLIRGLLEGLDIRRRWLAISGIFLVTVLLILGFEYWTGWNYYSNLQRKVSLLTELHKLAQENIESDKDLYPIYLETIQDLSERKVSPLRIPTIAFAPSATFWKVISGASFWIIFAIIALFGAFGQENKIAGSIILAIIAIFFGYIGSIIPTILNPWINYVGFPTLQIGVILFLSSRYQKKKGETN